MNLSSKITTICVLVVIAIFSFVISQVWADFACDTYCNAQNPTGSSTNFDNGCSVTADYGQKSGFCSSSSCPSVGVCTSIISCISCLPGPGPACIATHVVYPNSGIGVCDNGDTCCCQTTLSNSCPSCVPSNSCAATTPIGNFCSDGCGGTVAGTQTPAVACGVVECGNRIAGYSAESEQRSDCFSGFPGYTINSSFTANLSNCTGTTCYCSARSCYASCPDTTTYCAGNEPPNDCSGSCLTGTKSPSCPDASTYCPGAEPDDGCGNACPIGTKVCVGFSSIGFIKIQTPSGIIKLNVKAIGDADADDIVRIQMPGGITGVADMVDSANRNGSPVKIYLGSGAGLGTKYWRKLD